MNAGFGSWLLGTLLPGMAIGIFIVLAATSFGSALIYAISSFGFAVLAAPLLLLFLDPALAAMWPATCGQRPERRLIPKNRAFPEIRLSSGFGLIRRFGHNYVYTSVSAESGRERASPLILSSPALPPDPEIDFHISRHADYHFRNAAITHH
jgi:hypothetical protein